MNRRIVATLLALFTLFTVYNTLIPFDFAHGPGDLPELLGTISWSLTYFGENRPSLTDIVGNVFLFIPFGFLMHLFLRQRGVAAALPLTVAAGMLLSLGIEFTQLFIPNRNTALHDLVNNTAGSAVGAVGAMILSGRLNHWIARFSLDLYRRQPFSLVLLAIAAAQAVASAIPFTVVITVSHFVSSVKKANIVPFDYQSLGKLLRDRPNKLDLAGFDGSAMLADALFWVPVGWLLVLCYQRYWREQPRALWLLLGLPLLYFPALEGMQLFIASRITDINNVIAGYAGIAAGALLFRAMAGYRTRSGDDDLAQLTVPVLLYAVFMIFTGLRPFDFSMDPAVLDRDLIAENLIPFGAYFRSTGFGNIFDMVTTLCFFLPVSLYWTSRRRQEGRPFAAIYPVTILAGLATGLFIEVFQVFSLTRVGEVTDVMNYAIGGGLGTFLVYYYERQVAPMLERQKQEVKR